MNIAAVEEVVAPIVPIEPGTLAVSTFQQARGGELLLALPDRDGALESVHPPHTERRGTCRQRYGPGCAASFCLGLLDVLSSVTRMAESFLLRQPLPTPMQPLDQKLARSLSGNAEGFKIEVDLEVLDPPIDTEIFHADFLNLYNDRCDPRIFDVTGKPTQQYMISLPEGAGAAILEALGDASIRIQDKISDIKQPSNNKVTQREAIVKARVGQGKFRDDVFEMWNKQCPVTKVDMPAILVASHIVSWQLSTDEERIDPFNGFPLAPAVDKLFDKGYISFSDSGELLVHNAIRGEVLSRLGISPDAIITGLSQRHRAYLKRHRQTHGFSR